MSTRHKRKLRQSKAGAKRSNSSATESGVSECVSERVSECVSLYGGLKVPNDLLEVWKLCLELKPNSPLDAMSPLGVCLVGPFEILAGKRRAGVNGDLGAVAESGRAPATTPAPALHLHWRYFFDPPEFQTVARGDGETQDHLGYFRDSPDELPVFVGENVASKGCSINILGDNLFAALKTLADRLIRSAKKSSSASSSSAIIVSIRAALIDRATQLGLCLETKSPSLARRRKKVVCSLLHGAGMVVPVDSNDVGYREVPHSDAELRDICRKVADAKDDSERIAAFAPIVELSTLVQFANDESDYGMGLELGLNLFCHGSSYFHKMVSRTLSLSYSLLKRDLFGEIIAAHLANRSLTPLTMLS